MVVSNRFLVRQRKVYSRGMWVGTNLLALVPFLFFAFMFIGIAGSVGMAWPMLLPLTIFGGYLAFFIWTMVPGTSAMVTDEYDDL